MSYTKIIDELEIKNDLITEELDRIKAQNLQDDAKTRKQVKFAKMKLNNMACTINKLLIDMAEVHTCLDEIMSSSEMKLQEKGLNHPKEIVPSDDCIQNVSVLSPSDSLISQTTNPLSDISDETLLDDSQICNPERCEVSPSLLPVLFVADNGRNVQETNTEDLSERRSSKMDCNRLLTPELDIDLSFFKGEKLNRRRQTMFNISRPMEASSNSCEANVSNSSKMKSKEKIALQVESSVFESESNVSDTSGRASSTSCISPPLQCEEIFVQASHSPKLITASEILPNLCSHIKLLATIANQTLLLSEEMDITCKNATNLSLDLAFKSFVEIDKDLPYDSSKILPDVSSNINPLLSKTLLLNEDMILSGDISTVDDIKGKYEQLGVKKMTSATRSKKIMSKEYLGEPTTSMDDKGYDDRPKRQIKSVNYKEPSLVKKMRRDDADNERK